MKLRAFGYVRLSKDDESSVSIATQREAIAALCSARGWSLVETFSDVHVSAYDGRARPGLEKLLARLGDADVVVVLRLDRLARTLSELLKLGGIVGDAGVQLAAVDGEVDTTSATGRAFYHMRGVFAQFESDSLSERMKRMDLGIKLLSARSRRRAHRGFPRCRLARSFRGLRARCDAGAARFLPRFGVDVGIVSQRVGSAAIQKVDVGQIFAFHQIKTLLPDLRGEILPAFVRNHIDAEKRQIVILWN